MFSERLAASLQIFLQALGHLLGHLHCDGGILSEYICRCFPSRADRTATMQSRDTEVVRSYDALEKRLQDSNATPMSIPLEFLKEITRNFSPEYVLGQGGYGVVYKGVLRSGEVIAVKKLFEIHLLDDKAFQDEVGYLIEIKNQNIVQLIGYCAETSWETIKEPNGKFIWAEVPKRLLCFEYACNASLKKYISDESSGLEWDMRYDIIRGICSGLHFLHEKRRIVHMDLKPDNILMDASMTPKVSDFGLSRIFGTQQSRVITVNRAGSLGYMAPEYIDQGIISNKADIFSFGVIVIEILTGSRDYPYFLRVDPESTTASLRHFKEKVLGSWRNRFISMTKYKPIEIYIHQVTKCITIALKCVNPVMEKRPTADDIIQVFNAINQISQYPEDDMLGIDPRELSFPFELKKQMSCSLWLTNETDSKFAFILQNMSPLPYIIQPHKGIVPPQSKCSVGITLLPQEKIPRDMHRANEFLVRSIKVNGCLAVEHITTKMFSKDSGVVDEVKLDVVFDVEENTKLNDDPAVEDIATNTSIKESVLVAMNLDVVSDAEERTKLYSSPAVEDIAILVDDMNLDVVSNAEDRTKFYPCLAAGNISTKMFNKESDMVDEVNLNAAFDAVKSSKVTDCLVPEDITRRIFSIQSNIGEEVNLDIVSNAEERSSVNDVLAAEDMTTNMSSKESGESTNVNDGLPGTVINSSKVNDCPVAEDITRSVLNTESNTGEEVNLDIASEGEDRSSVNDVLAVEDMTIKMTTTENGLEESTKLNDGLPGTVININMFGEKIGVVDEVNLAMSDTKGLLDTQTPEPNKLACADNVGGEKLHVLNTEKTPLPLQSSMDTCDNSELGMEWFTRG